MGVHWAILQSVAWTGMVICYSHEGSFREALQKTFDGKHPCKLCKIVTAAKKSEKKEASQKPIHDLDFLFNAPRISLLPCLSDNLIAVPDHLLLSRNEAPLTPPPRALPG
jgi:hypothetical protein